MRKVVEQNKSFIKDTTSRAVVNRDYQAYVNYMQHIRKKQQENDRMRDMIRDINSLKTEMYEIKDLLKKVIK